MPIDLNDTLDHRSTDPDVGAMLDDLQPNILKGHVREHCYFILLQFDPARPDEARAFLRDIGKKMKSAKKHLEEVDVFRATGEPGTPFIGVFLSAKGYEALGIHDAEIPHDSRFRAGMKASRATLGDPDPGTEWDCAYRKEIHALLLVGSANTSKSEIDALKVSVTPGPEVAVIVLGEETGKALYDRKNKSIEHFGYVDGISQPLFLKKDIDTEVEEQTQGGGTHSWYPGFPLKQVLVRESEPVGNRFGSYVVFRKLEQNPQAFRFKLLQIAAAYSQTIPGPEDLRLAGATLVGRFENGTPLLSHPSASNDFDYANDPSGQRCPFNAHIRRVNPRGDTVIMGSTSDLERSHFIARRGVTYGDRKHDPQYPGAPISEVETKDIGLLFLAYQSDIANQFEFIQQQANDSNFLKGGAGMDPLIGQNGQIDSSSLIKMKGGEYLFAPSITFIKSL